MDDVLIGFVTGAIAVAAVFVPLTLLRKGTRLVTRKPSKLTAWSSPLSPAEVLKLTVETGKAAGYAVDTEAEGCVVLRSSISALTWGFFLPVYAIAAANGTSRVEIGIVSRAIQMGPLVTRAHHKLAEQLGGPLRLSPLPA